MNIMTLALTQSDFRTHLKKYLDEVNENDETVYVTRSNHRAVAIVSQEKLDWLERLARAKDDSLEYAIARDQLIQRGVLPDDKIVESDDDYWGQFEK